ncbi:6-hydroxymethylpterin diphosphokinase MptE-like protein [Eisenbergiella sp.]
MTFREKMMNTTVRFVNTLVSLKMKMLNKEFKKELKRNEEIKDIHKGERCFIVGCGPSLRNQNLKLLRDEYVFSVNQLMRSPFYSEIHSNFHVMADGLYFDLDPNRDEHKSVIQNICGINTEENTPICFFPITAKPFIDSIPNFSNLRIQYFNAATATYERMRKRLDLTKTIPTFCTVTQFAIAIAVYMGFHEIILLGCDMTGYKEVEQFATGNFVDGSHVYTENKEDMQKALHKDRNCEQWFNGFAQMFTDYRRMFEYCNRRDISLINATDGGVLDSIPRVNYMELFSGEKNE